MRNSRALAALVAAGAVVGLAAPTAAAWAGPSNIVAMPSVIARGGQLTVTVDNCEAPGTVESPAFPKTNLKPITPGTTSSATVTVHHNAHPGAFDITANCNGKTLTRPSAFTVIHGGVRGGLGGSTTSGATSTDMAIGGTLVGLALVGGGVFWLRRRAESKA
ncbi:hypothetical protein [Streptomyces sp. G45]|uniref:hypothetical protein n=1 Tax=Streptomyces sp. G45 TaxID=3406627 RepID=UPI003C189BB8